MPTIAERLDKASDVLNECIISGIALPTATQVHVMNHMDEAAALIREMEKALDLVMRNNSRGIAGEEAREGWRLARAALSRARGES